MNYQARIALLITCIRSVIVDAVRVESQCRIPEKQRGRGLDALAPVGVDRRVCRSRGSGPRHGRFAVNEVLLFNQGKT